METTTQSPLDFSGEKPAKTTPPAVSSQEQLATPPRMPAEPISSPPAASPVAEGTAHPMGDTAPPEDIPEEAPGASSHPVSEGRFQDSYIGGRKENPVWKN